MNLESQMQAFKAYLDQSSKARQVITSTEVGDWIRLRVENQSIWFSIFDDRGRD